jgi:phage repressor protein C with HTH and peptisase S24 domain
VPDSTTRYLDAVLASASLARRDAAAVREELAAHAHAILEAAEPRPQDEQEVFAMLEREMGSAEELGASIADAKGRFRTGLKKQLRRVPVALAAVLVLVLGVRAYAAEVFRIGGTSMDPILPNGAHVLVEKWSDPEVGDIVVFRDAAGINIVATVDAVGEDALTLSKANASARGDWPRLLDAADVVGRVWLIRR